MIINISNLFYSYNICGIIVIEFIYVIFLTLNIIIDLGVTVSLCI